MSWSINLNGHVDADGTEAEAVEQLVKDFTILAKKAEVGLSYVSANVPNKGQRTYFNASAGLDFSEGEDEEETLGE